MKFVENRTFILIRPKKTLAKWVNHHDDEVIPEKDILSSNTLYMVEDIDYDSPEAILKLVKMNYRDIFLNELWVWYEDEEYLPKNISFKLFTEWFDYEFIDMCFDTIGTDVITG